MYFLRTHSRLCNLHKFSHHYYFEGLILQLRHFYYYYTIPMLRKRCCNTYSMVTKTNGSTNLGPADFSYWFCQRSHEWAAPDLQPNLKCWTEWWAHYQREAQPMAAKTAEILFLPVAPCQHLVFCNHQNLYMKYKPGFSKKKLIFSWRNMA